MRLMRLKGLYILDEFKVIELSIQSLKLLKSNSQTNLNQPKA